jgi:hypothetical protein
MPRKKTDGTKPKVTEKQFEAVKPGKIKRLEFLIQRLKSTDRLKADIAVRDRLISLLASVGTL